MSHEKKKTVGAQAQELQQKAQQENENIDVRDLRQEMVSEEFMRTEIDRCIADGTQKLPGDFYIVMLTKREKLIENSLRIYFVVRQSCPTPQYDQVVYYYHRGSGTLQFMWCIPDQQTATRLYYDVSDRSIAPELRQYVADFFNNTLLNKARAHNNEA